MFQLLLLQMLLISLLGLSPDIQHHCATGILSLQFTSALWAAVVHNLGIKLHHTTSYHPQANGLREHFHRSMKSVLRAALKDDNRYDWLPLVLLGLRTAPKEDLLAC